MVKIHFEKYEKFEKIQNFEISIAKVMPVRKWELDLRVDHNQLLTFLLKF